MSDRSNLIDVKIHIGFLLTVNEDHGRTFLSNGDCSISINGFLFFTVPTNEPTPILSFNQYFALSHQSLPFPWAIFFNLVF